MSKRRFVDTYQEEAALVAKIDQLTVDRRGVRRERCVRCRER
ncbi:MULTISPECIES: hypothetical protein [Exiguobacterium]|nr:MULTISPECIES: hypothetical protein [Exiguobacterium]